MEGAGTMSGKSCSPTPRAALKKARAKMDGPGPSEDQAAYAAAEAAGDDEAAEKKGKRK
ncbi:hypothetical protein ACRAVF_19085 [Bradyrhizobium oligotrophicum S58]